MRRLFTLIPILTACPAPPFRPGPPAAELDPGAIFLGPKPGFAGGADRLLAAAFDGEALVTAGWAEDPRGRRRGLLMRFLPSGALDPGFGSGGAAVIESAERFDGVVVDATGRIV